MRKDRKHKIYPSLLGHRSVDSLGLHISSEDAKWTLITAIFAVANWYDHSIFEVVRQDALDKRIVAIDTEFHHFSRCPTEIGIAYLDMRDVISHAPEK